MKKHTCEQGSSDWFELRCGRVTASEAKSLITPKFKIKTGDAVRTLLATKLAEAWIGPLPGFTSWDTEQGKLLEERAIPRFELATGQDVERVGFVESDDGRTGCSPDGLLPNCGLEVKCLQAVHHVGVLLDGGLPDDFAAQVHFSMLVTGLPQWKLFCYNPRFPHLLVTVNQDAEIQKTMREALDIFFEYYDDAWSVLVEKNGGPPPVRLKTTDSDKRPLFSWEQNGQQERFDVPTP